MSLALRKPKLSEQFELKNDEPASARDDVIEYDDGLLAVAGPIIIVCYSLLFTIAAFTFYSGGYSFFVVVISIFFAVVYYAIPVIFLKIRAARDPRWRRDASAKSPTVDVWTGSMRRSEAIAQIVSIPLAILMGFILLAIRWNTL